MGANSQAAYALYPDGVALTEVVKKLSEGGFDRQSLCMMLSPAHPVSTIVRESSQHPFERGFSATTAGLIGWLSEFGAVVIPTFGFFIHSQTYFRSLVEERESTGQSGGRGTLLSLGFCPEYAQKIEKQVSTGKVLLYVSCPDSEMMPSALQILRGTGSIEVGTMENEPHLQQSNQRKRLEPPAVASHRSAKSAALGQNG